MNTSLHKLNNSHTGILLLTYSREQVVRVRANTESHTQAVGGQRKWEPGIHCLWMRLISQKSWVIENYRVIFVQSWCHNIYLPIHRSHNFWPICTWEFLDCCPTSPSTLQWVGISNMSLKTVQVASILDVCWGKYVFIQLLPVLRIVTVCYRL